MKYPVKCFKSMKIALKELAPFIKNGSHLRTGQPFKSFGGMRSREILANWLLCATVNAISERTLTLYSDPTGGDGILQDSTTGQTWWMEHVLVPPRRADDGRCAETLILHAINQKRSKGASAYASGKTLVVFLDSGTGTWFPNKVARKLPEPLLFNSVWVVGLKQVDDKSYTYYVTSLDISSGDAPTYLVGIDPAFDTWWVVDCQQLGDRPKNSPQAAPL